MHDAEKLPKLSALTAAISSDVRAWLKRLKTRRVTAAWDKAFLPIKTGTSSRGHVFPPLYMHNLARNLVGQLELYGMLDTVLRIIRLVLDPVSVDF